MIFLERIQGTRCRKYIWPNFPGQQSEGCRCSLWIHRHRYAHTTARTPSDGWARETRKKRTGHCGWNTSCRYVPMAADETMYPYRKVLYTYQYWTCLWLLLCLLVHLCELIGKATGKFKHLRKVGRMCPARFGECSKLLEVSTFWGFVIISILSVTLFKMCDHCLDEIVHCEDFFYTITLYSFYCNNYHKSKQSLTIK